MNPNSEYQTKSELNANFEQLVANIEEQKWLEDIYKKEFSNYEGVDVNKTCHIVEGGNLAYITVDPQNNDLLGGLLIKF